MKCILIAGGTGLIGKALSKELRNLGYEVYVLSRNPKGKDHFYWNPLKGEIDHSILNKVEVLINLSGEGLTEKRWSKSQKQLLWDSRVQSNTFLFQQVSLMPNLEHFISASGINCYGFEHPEKIYKENDEYGYDFTSKLVKAWEESADFFQSICKVTKIRTGVALDSNAIALKKMLGPIQKGLGSPIGSGKQMMCWIHLDDLVHIYIHILEKKLEGVYHANGGCTSNENLLKSIARLLQKPFFLPNVPEFVLYLMFGEMADLLVNGISADNSKIKKTGFHFKYETIDQALKEVLI